MTAIKTPENRAEAEQIGQRIRDRRHELGLSQSQLASMIRTRTGRHQSVSKISQWERGSSAPERSKRPELADALQTTTLALFGDVDETTLMTRIDLLERKVDAIVLLHGLGDAVDGMVRQGRQADRRSAQDGALAEGKASKAAEAKARIAKLRPAPKKKRSAS